MQLAAGWYTAQSWLVDDASVKQILAPSATGVTIASSSGGSVYNWASEASGFDRSTTTYSYLIYPLVFATEAANYTIGAAGTVETGPGPVGYWSFDEGFGATAQDSTVNNNNGTITGATWQDESQCVAGKCLWFDGINGTRVNADAPDNMNRATICLWTKLTSLTNTDSDTAITLVDKPGMLRFNNSGRVSLDVPAGVNPYVESSENLILNKWYFICGVYEGIGVNPALYINGVDKSSGQISGSGQQGDDSADPLRIGANYINEDASNFNGFIDEVKIYPYARSAQQIQEDYAAGLAGIGTSHGVSVAFGSASDKWMSDGLVGYWKMDEATTTSGALDASGNGNTGTYYGNASTTGGKYGNGGVFDGVEEVAWDDCIVIDDNDLFNFGETTNKFTVSSWFKISNITDGYRKTIINKEIGSGNAVFRINLDTNGYLWFATTNGTSVSLDTYNGGPHEVFDDGQWHQAIGVVDGDNDKIYLYVDGELKRTGLFTGIIDGTNSKTYIGARAQPDIPDEEYFSGQLDEVRIYNRALSSDEVRKLYEWAPGPVAHWKMDEFSGTTAYDSAASTTFSGGNHGEIDGATWSNRGKIGSALSFDGISNNRVVIGSRSAFDFSPGGGFSASLWFKKTTDCAGSNEVMLSRFGSSDTVNTWWFGCENSSDVLALNLFDTVGEEVWLAGQTVIDDGSWHNAYFSYDGDNDRACLYLDGIPEACAAAALSAEIISSNPLCIGNYDADCISLHDFSGALDEIKIYNYVRTQKQILEDMNGGPGLYPVLDLKFDEGKGATAYDSSGYSNNSTLYPGTGGSNTATSAMWTMDGKNGKAMEFDGTDDYVSIPDNSSLDVTAGQNMTYSLWVKTTQGMTLNKYWALYNKESNPQHGAEIALHDSTDDARWSFAFINNGTNWITVYGHSDIADGQWHHLVGIKEGNTLKTYQDGVFANSTSDNLLLTVDFSNNTPALIGAFAGYDPTHYHLNGLIDEVKIYPYALTEEEIKMDYNQGKAAVMGAAGKSNSAATSSNAGSLEYCVPGSTDYCASPVGEWKMDEFAGGTAYDTSGQGNNGTIYGAAWSDRAKFGSALSFDGVDDYTSINDFDDVGNSNKEISVFTWIKGSPGQSRKGIVTHSDADIDERSWSIRTQNLSPNNKFEVLISDDGTINSGHSKAYVSSPIILDNNWHQIGFVFNNGSLSLYSDGKVDPNPFKDTDGAITTLNNTTAKLGMGSYVHTGYVDSYFGGLIDNIKIYNYARTPAQIAYDFNGGKPIAHWRFDECKGGTIYDSAKSWNGGTANNGTLYLGTSGVTATGTCASSSSSFWYNGRTGKYNSAGSFDGTDDWVNLNSGIIDQTGNSTFSFWAKNNGDMDSSNAALSATPDNIFNIYPDMDEYIKISLGWKDWSFDNTSHAKVPIGVWAHYVVVIDTNLFSLYLNGNSIWSSARTENTYSPTSWQIGSRQSGATAYYNGQIDEVKIFNYALTAEQIKSEYTGGAVRFGE